MATQDEINKRRKDGWIEAWFAIEAIGVERDTVVDALKAHVEKLSRVPNALVYETSFKDVREAGTPPKALPGQVAWSQVADVKLFTKDISTLLNIIVVYGPSSIEILGPSRKEVKIDELQSAANVLAAILHEFASRGIGGILVSAEPKKEQPTR